jgi:hypothetical protein
MSSKYENEGVRKEVRSDSSAHPSARAISRDLARSNEILPVEPLSIDRDIGHKKDDAG